MCGKTDYSFINLKITTMKKIFTFLLLSFFTAAAFAFGPQTRLTISSAYAGQLRITVDGNNYQIDNKAAADLVINNLLPGSHSIKIYKPTGRRIVSNSASRILYSATVYLRPQYHTDLVVNRFGKVFTDEVQMTGKYFEDNNYPDNNYPAQYNQQMTQQNFDALKAAVKKEAFDNTRLNIAKQAGAANYFSAAQVKEFIQIFSFDESRLDLAKFLYNRTTDKANYFTVNDAFTYSDSKDKLSEYIRQQP
jgi:hypothetical protein